MSDVFRSVDAFRSPTISAHWSPYAPAANSFCRAPGSTTARAGTSPRYSTGSGPAARAEGIPADQAAELQAKADVLFKGETLRAIMLNAYGWWTVATIAPAMPVAAAAIAFADNAIADEENETLNQFAEGLGIDDPLEPAQEKVLGVGHVQVQPEGFA